MADRLRGSASRVRCLRSSIDHPYMADTSLDDALSNFWALSHLANLTPAKPYVVASASPELKAETRNHDDRMPQSVDLDVRSRRSYAWPFLSSISPSISLSISISLSRIASSFNSTPVFVSPTHATSMVSPVLDKPRRSSHPLPLPPLRARLTSSLRWSTVYWWRSGVFRSRLAASLLSSVVRLETFCNDSANMYYLLSSDFCTEFGCSQSSYHAHTREEGDWFI
ncbi:hypothetical protein L227DRAFT_152081 [Lentinus tigrinus ALCF2SS1-6]|uniref:Uncharacterized protein n=1 Tax=Lentinus tigrinus ALCF2SS1-6 TaxID=1328759 RepID=A0A5C2S6T6_9APHY|nr:hypothetical protein L227DRAFT_152081 [Lentinus tigrinus ALCF2SS1-6]